MQEQVLDASVVLSNHYHPGQRGYSIKTDMGSMTLDLIACWAIRTYKLLAFNRACVFFAWVCFMLVCVREDPRNFFVIFLPDFATSWLTRVQFVALIIYYYGSCVTNRPSFYQRFLGALCVAVIV